MTLSVLGGLAATEGIKFLYGQAADLLKAWRDRRSKGSGDVSVPVRSSSALDATPAQTAPDIEVLEKAEKQLVALSGALSPYALDQADIDVDDATLAAAAGDLRSLLEAIYHQRLTFRGEQREPTGSSVTVKQAIEVLAGEALGAKADVKSGSNLDVDQVVGTVTEGGSLTGFDGTLGT